MLFAIRNLQLETVSYLCYKYNKIIFENFTLWRCACVKCLHSSLKIPFRFWKDGGRWEITVFLVERFADKVKWETCALISRESLSRLWSVSALQQRQLLSRQLSNNTSHVYMPSCWYQLITSTQDNMRMYELWNS